MKVRKGDKVMFLGNLDYHPYWEQRINALGLKPMQIVEVVKIFKGLLSIPWGQFGVLLPPKYFQKVEEDYEVHENQNAPAAECQACTVPDVRDRC